ncbi:MAG: CDP-diacylglycerol--glycerol-3-phosphate 3-phosphatidyltransferase [Watsoniomyces obsoletus]|nr:MAG: CDP-diacylglycerol--glycerol-3-phosphate 3-phosphatidyltransferase [Watsoniomyces obsoletus]
MSTANHTAPVPHPAPPSPLSAFAGLQDELDKLSPRFAIRASQIQIIQSPKDFYDTLKSKILTARRRIYLSTLYIGKNEYELVNTIRQALSQNPELKVSILTDALRGTRETPEPSCASLLVPLVAEFGAHRVEIRMYHTPNLTGVRKRIIPRRINEGWGLQHMKLANLSSDYFSNRQDRYHLISSQRVTDYFASIHHAVGALSYRVEPDTEDRAAYHLRWPESNPAPSPLEDPKRFIASAGTLLNPLIRAVTPRQRPLEDSIQDTILYPLAQFTPLLRPDTSTEYPTLMTVLRRLATDFAGSRWTFTAGYFNIRPELQSLLLASRCERGVVVTASPWSNGFYGSKGVSGMLPSAYTLLSRRFLEAVQRAGLTSSIQLKEWRRGTIGKEGGWTYHAKGLWVTLPAEDHPSMTLVGSSNYTKRSYSLDLETNVLILTRNSDLQSRLAAEETWLQDHARMIDLDEFTKTERRVGLHVRVAMWIVSLVGGAL